jgi:rubrerythrin
MLKMKTISLRTALVVFGVGAITLSGLGYAAGSLQASTKKDLMAAMQGEAFATLKYLAYADAARAHGNPQLAALFESTAKVERDEHFAEHAKLYGLVGSDADNLRNAIKGENYEATQMYPQMAQRAEAVGDKGVAQHFREVGADEAKHRDAFQSALGTLTTK